jgi:hypothetical protein
MTSDGLNQKAAEFCAASVRDWTGRAARMLAETPELEVARLLRAYGIGETT